MRTSTKRLITFLLGYSLVVTVVFPVVSSCAPLAPFLPSTPNIPGFSGSTQIAREFQRLGVDFQLVKGLIGVPEVQEVADRLGLAANNLKPEEEYFLGRTVLAQLLTDYDNQVLGIVGKGRDATTTPEYEYVASVAEIIHEATERANTSPRKRSQTGLRVAIVPHRIPNAYAAPGGFVLVTTGMLALLDSEDELAAVLAHESAHVSLGHGVAALGRERLGKDISQGVQILSQAVGPARDAILGDMAGELRDFGSGVAGALRSGYDKSWEHQADKLAANILREAGYDARALITVIERVDVWQAQNGSGGSFAATHPTGRERCDALRALPEHRLEGSALAEANAARATRFQGNVPPMASGRLAHR